MPRDAKAAVRTRAWVRDADPVPDSATTQPGARSRYVQMRLMSATYRICGAGQDSTSAAAGRGSRHARTRHRPCRRCRAHLGAVGQDERPQLRCRPQEVEPPAVSGDLGAEGQANPVREGEATVRTVVGAAAVHVDGLHARHRLVRHLRGGQSGGAAVEDRHGGKAVRRLLSTSDGRWRSPTHHEITLHDHRRVLRARTLARLQHHAPRRALPCHGGGHGDCGLSSPPCPSL